MGLPAPPGLRAHGRRSACPSIRRRRLHPRRPASQDAIDAIERSSATGGSVRSGVSPADASLKPGPLPRGGRRAASVTSSRRRATSCTANGSPSGADAAGQADRRPTDAGTTGTGTTDCPWSRGQGRGSMPWATRTVSTSAASWSVSAASRRRTRWASGRPSSARAGPPWPRPGCAGC